MAEKATPAGAPGGAGLRTDSDIAAQARGLTGRELQKASADWLSPLPDGDGGLGAFASTCSADMHTAASLAACLHAASSLCTVLRVSPCVDLHVPPHSIQVYPLYHIGFDIPVACRLQRMPAPAAAAAAVARPRRGTSSPSTASASTCGRRTVRRSTLQSWTWPPSPPRPSPGQSASPAPLTGTAAARVISWRSEAWRPTRAAMAMTA